MFEEKDMEDLKNEIVYLKRQNAVVEKENYLLKVKIRKLEGQLQKKDKEIDAIIEPFKSHNYQRVMNERSANYIMEMNDKLEKYEKSLSENEVCIRRLREQLRMTKLYGGSSQQRRNNKQANNQTNVLKFVDNILNQNLEDNEPESQQDLNGIINKEIIDQKTVENLTVLDVLKINRDKSNSPESDLERTELYEQPSHVEIQKLHEHFVDMIVEVDLLKSTIKKLETEQVKTKEQLKEKT